MLAYLDRKSGEEVCEACVERLLLNADGPYRVEGEGFECSVCGTVFSDEAHSS